MNIRRTIKMLSIVGAGMTVGATVLPGTANSAAPGFGNWNVTGGNVQTLTSPTGTAGCPTGYSCAALVSGSGFLQTQVTETSSGTSYVWTIVTGSTSTGGAPGSGSAVPFSDENFVVTNQSGTGNSVTGIADKQGITDNTNGNFSSAVQVLTGFAAQDAGVGNQVTIQQHLNNSSTAGALPFNTTFNMTVALNASGVQTGRSMDIDQLTTLNSSGDKQVFAIRGRSGTFLSTTTGTSLTLGTGSSAQTVTWTPNADDVMLTWVGQGLTLGSLGSSQFGFEGITNNTTAPAAGSKATTFSLTNTGPFAWPTDNGNNDFGAAPAY